VKAILKVGGDQYVGPNATHQHRAHGEVKTGAH